jgi:transcriptional regulator with XRE-family HTH domain
MDFKRLKSIIEKLCNERNISQVALCARIGITPQGLSEMYKKERMKVVNLEAIAKVLEVSPCLFFNNYEQTGLHPGNVSEPGNEYTPNKCKELNDKLQRLENELRLKDELIRTYHQLISNNGIK